MSKCMIKKQKFQKILKKGKKKNGVTYLRPTVYICSELQSLVNVQRLLSSFLRLTDREVTKTNS